jgi:hypothetical protein
MMNDGVGTFSVGEGGNYFTWEVTNALTTSVNDDSMMEPFRIMFPTLFPVQIRLAN